MLIEVFRKIQGPYSLVYLNGQTKELYFIRDSLGRQTLLLGQIEGHLWLTSVVSHKPLDFYCIELPPLGMYRIKLESKEVDLFPWQDIDKHEIYEQQLVDVQACLGMPVNVHSDYILPVWLGLPRDTFEVGLTYFLI